MDEPYLHGRNRDSEDNQHLSVSHDRPKDGPRHSRSISPAPSSDTAVEDNPNADLEDIRKAAMKRRQTLVPEVNLTWWDCFKGTLGFGFLKAVKRKLNAKVDIVQLGPPDEPVRNHPFSLTVSVFPCPNSTVTQRKTAKCMLDTGCSQGNIVSAEFAQILGYTAFEPLKHTEENGGTVATGNIHTVSGAVHISWFHNSSPKVFRNMRFLVSDTAPVDLVVGSSSIVKHNLISPPNFMVVDNIQSDPAREELVGAQKRLKRECDNVKETKGKNHAEYKDKKGQYEIATRKLSLYDEARRLSKEQDKDPTKQTPDQAKETQLAIEKHREKIQELEETLKKSGISAKTIDELKGVKKTKSGLREKLKSHL